MVRLARLENLRLSMSHRFPLLRTKQQPSAPISCRFRRQPFRLFEDQRRSGATTPALRLRVLREAAAPVRQRPQCVPVHVSELLPLARPVLPDDIRDRQHPFARSKILTTCKNAKDFNTVP
jgi:hypothetical protein